MTNELSIHAVHRDGMRVQAGNGKHEIVMDYPLTPSQEVSGLTALETLLASLCACAANTVKVLLVRRMNQPVTGLEVNARAVRRPEHPTVLTEIGLEFVVRGAVEPDAIGRAIKAAEEQICPVWNMLKGGTTITTSFRIVAAGQAVATHV
jgi:uncharacterized OsmC-like protein